MTNDSPTLLPGPRTTAVLLLLAALGETAELALSPLDGSSTVRDLAGIAAHQVRFEVSVTIGTVSTMLFAAGFLGLAQACRPTSRRLATWAGWVALASMGGYLGVRMSQALELSGVREGLDRSALARTVDGLVANPVGGLIGVVFLGGALIGTWLLAIVCWRAGMPRWACAALALFQVVDLLAPWHPVPWSHLLLLGAFLGIGHRLWARGPRTRLRLPPEVRREAQDREGELRISSPRAGARARPR